MDIKDQTTSSGGRNEVWFITGVDKGIGCELSKKCAAENKIVIAACLNTDSCETLNRLANEKKNLHIVPLDVTDQRSIENCFNQVRNELNITHIDVFVNNAGILGSTKHPLDVNEEEMLNVYWTNCVGPALLIKTFWPLISNADNAKVIALSSPLGSMEEMKTKYKSPLIAYGASKAALNMLFSLYASSDLGRNVTFALIHPGHVDTDLGVKAAEAERSHEPTMSSKESVDSWFGLVENLTHNENGKFFSYDGKEMAF